MRMLKKKAQIGMLETMAVLFIFFFLLMIGMIFYVSVMRTQSARELHEKQQVEAIEIASKALFLPDLECPTTMKKLNCLDIYKLEAVEQIIQDNPHYLELYYDNLRFSEIVVSEVYGPEEGRSWRVYKREKPDSSGRIFIHMPIVLYDPMIDEYHTGIMNVSYYGWT
ncbi:hypothetical protein GF351_01235 [Candidatus Woesearchaeota archaeon]|nr:hypothetical protein [Candidatus Woesearchaeota archaeon]